eukprot:1804152-Rhodomonas_salina.2
MEPVQGALAEISVLSDGDWKETATDDVPGIPALVTITPWELPAPRAARQTSPGIDIRREHLSDRTRAYADSQHSQVAAFQSCNAKATHSALRQPGKGRRKASRGACGCYDEDHACAPACGCAASHRCC